MEIYLSNDIENKALSWVSKSFIKKSNPNKRDRIIFTKIDFERVNYMFFGNFLY